MAWPFHIIITTITPTIKMLTTELPMHYYMVYLQDNFKTCQTSCGLAYFVILALKGTMNWASVDLFIGWVRIDRNII